jgi:hypothetical protein
MERKTTNYYEDPLPASDSMLAIEILYPEGQETRESASERGDAKQHGETDLHGMALVESGKEEHNTRKEAT